MNQVIQIDRDAAADALMDAHGLSDNAEMRKIREGQCDTHFMVQSFASHRTQAACEVAEKMGRILDHVERFEGQTRFVIADWQLEELEALTTITRKLGEDRDVAVKAVVAVSQVDKGPWRVDTSGDRVYLESDDFTHDARLYLDGDFRDMDQRLAYVRGIAEALTRATNEPVASSPREVTENTELAEALEKNIKEAVRYIPIGDGYFDPYANNVEAVDAAVDDLIAKFLRIEAP